MEVISIIVMFVFGNMNDQEHRMTQYVPMESLSSCMKEVAVAQKENQLQDILIEEIKEKGNNPLAN